MKIIRVKVGPIRTNCYLVIDEVSRQAMAVDPGDDADKISHEITRHNLQVSSIVLTHGHLDHILAVEEIRKLTGAPVMMHEGDQCFFGKPLMSPTFGVRYPVLVPQRWLKDGDIIECGSLRFTVMHTPGHTPGGICIYGEGILFSGDMLFRGRPGSGEFLRGDPAEVVTSLQKILSLSPETKVYPGHGSETTIGAENRGKA